MKKLILLICCVLGILGVNGQGLENVIIETYYISDADDATDTDGGYLAPGSVTYRIFIDMAAGYELQAVYGNASHELRIESTAPFFNNEDRGEMLGTMIPDNRIDENTVALDSWVSMGGATTLRRGVLKTVDGDGSLVGGVNNDGGSAGIAGGLLVNNDPLAGIPLTTADGLIAGLGAMVTVVNVDLSMLDNVNSSNPLVVNNGAWSVLEGTQGADAENRVIIAQITTTGELSFTLNVQLGAPDGSTEQYVASNPIGDEQFFAGLTYPNTFTGEGCTSETACNYDPLATTDDGSCIEPVAGCYACNLNGDGLVLVDADGDGICDGEEIGGCTSPTACNYESLATDDDGSCIEPVVNCQICNDNNDGLVIVDDDNDGICNADENPGCTDPAACNYDALATGDDGSCIIPVENCSSCNDTNDGLVIIDADGDGICNAEEVSGCTDDSACNFNAGATENDGSCVFPTENCYECLGGGLVLVDADDDGICNAEEVPGCTNVGACNYNPNATDDNGSCIVPEENCWECNDNNDGLVIVDTDGDGICDAEEVLGCTSPTACNYDPEALVDDNSCIEPVEDCFECNENNDGLVIIDTDGDGVCDAEEVPGCTDPLADNYNPEATEDDGSCTYSEAPCNDEFGLEEVVVELYYISDENDSNDEDGGSELALNSRTYRVYADLKEGYELQAVFGNEDHLLRYETSTLFYNNADRGEVTGDIIPADRLDENTVALDSWLAMGAASDEHWGVLKTEDTDGSVIGGINNDGGSEAVEGGLLVNDSLPAGIPLTVADGMLEQMVATVTSVGIDLAVFGDQNLGGLFTTNNGAYSVLEGVQGPTAENRVLIGQFTTDGEFCFEINLQLGTPDGGVVQYVASNPLGDQVQCDRLQQCGGCTNPDSPNYDSAATFDDGSCIIISVSEISRNVQIEAFPNPTSDDIILTISGFNGNSAKYVITNLLGDVVMTKNINNMGSERNELISLEGLAAGVYNLTLFGEDRPASIRIVKH